MRYLRRRVCLEGEALLQQCMRVNPLSQLSRLRTRPSSCKRLHCQRTSVSVALISKEIHAIFCGSRFWTISHPYLLTEKDKINKPETISASHRYFRYSFSFKSKSLMYTTIWQISLNAAYPATAFSSKSIIIA